MNSYALYGLTIESEVPLDAPEAAARNGAPDYRISLGERPQADGPPTGRVLAELQFGELTYWCAEDENDPGRWLLRYSGLCDVEVDRGAHEIRVHPGPDADREALGLLLGSNVLARILSGDGELVLHASAVEVGGRALAIAAGPGGGKTTLAALLCARGARLVSDDALRVDTENGVCFPGTMVLRLRQGAAALAAEFDDGKRSETADGRIAMRPPAVPGNARLPLAAMILPQPSRGSGELEIERLTAKDALLELLRYPRSLGWLELGPVRSHFGNASRLASALPAYRAAMPWGPPFPSSLSNRLLQLAGLPTLA